MCAVAALAITACGGSSKTQISISQKLDEVERIVNQMESAAAQGDMDKVYQLSIQVQQIGDEISAIEAKTPATAEETQRAIELMVRMSDIAE